MFAFIKSAEYQNDTTNMKDEGLKSLCRHINLLSSQIKAPFAYNTHPLYQGLTFEKDKNNKDK